MMSRRFEENSGSGWMQTAQDLGGDFSAAADGDTLNRLQSYLLGVDLEQLHSDTSFIIHNNIIRGTIILPR